VMRSFLWCVTVCNTMDAIQASEMVISRRHGMQQSVNMCMMIRSGVQLEILYFVFVYLMLQAGADPEVVIGGNRGSGTQTPACPGPFWCNVPLLKAEHYIAYGLFR